jgi:hypothetical protein
MIAAAAREPAKASVGCWRPYRSLHVIDLESLAGASSAPASSSGGSPCAPEELLRQAWAAYRHAIGIQRGDHAMLGLRADSCGRLADLLAVSGAQLRVAPDVCGVRTALAESVDVSHAARRFDWLVIAGGGEELAGLATAGRASGMPVWLVTGASSLVPELDVLRMRRSRLLLGCAAA